MNNVDAELNKDVAALLAGRIFKRMEQVQQGDLSALPIVTAAERQIPEARRAEQMARDKFKESVVGHDLQHLGLSWSSGVNGQRLEMHLAVYQAAVCLRAGLGNRDNNEAHAHDYSADDAVTEAFAIWNAVKERAFLF